MKDRYASASSHIGNIRRGSQDPTILMAHKSLLASSLQSSNRKPLEITMPNLANGFLCFGPATFVSVAFILSQFAQQGCSFVGLPSEGQDTNIFDKNTAAYAGIYCWQGVGGQKWLYAYAWEGLGYARQMALASTVMGAVLPRRQKTSKAQSQRTTKFVQQQIGFIGICALFS
eukprot:scaffold8947_cov124-Skeletonema_dohrnii-CCMP3373.AAC.8